MIKLILFIVGFMAFCMLVVWLVERCEKWIHGSENVGNNSQDFDCKSSPKKGF